MHDSCPQHPHVLLTGGAGFIGAALALRLGAARFPVTIIDSINDYYDPELKTGRFSRLGFFSRDFRYGAPSLSDTIPGMRFIRGDIADDALMERIFSQGHFSIVINLAAQAGVRYSLENPRSYIRSNIDGFLNILEGCRRHPVSHLLYASSSSVYGRSTEVPYREEARADAPESLYAATKRSDELMASCYSRLYGIPATGLRFFTVYGPWGRPDMAPFIFLRNILEGKPVNMFNHGRMRRDFTYVDDVVESVFRLISLPPEGEKPPHRILNVGNSAPVDLPSFIAEIEKASGRKAEIISTGMQPGDVETTYADSSRLQALTGFRPSTPLARGIACFTEWYRSFYNVH